MSKSKSRRWFYAKPDLIKICFICDSQIKVKYVLPKKQYSLKNNWGYWTHKHADQNKYICNSCLMKLHRGTMRGWIPCSNKAENFYQYVHRNSFDE